MSTTRPTTPRRDALARPPSAAEAVIQGLRQAILSGDLPGDARVLQDGVAAQFGVSQTTVREAFRQLAAEGFLHAEPRRGMRVIGLSLDDAAELVRLRRAIEGQALTLAMPQLQAVDLVQAEATLKRLDAATDPQDILTLNAAFHDTLYAPSAQPRTLALIASLRHAFSRYFRYLCDETGHASQSQDEHWQLLALCAARDVPGACAALDQHICATWHALSHQLET